VICADFIDVSCALVEELKSPRLDGERFRRDPWGAWLLEGSRLLAIAIIFATLVGAWMFRYENVGVNNSYHRNRLTGAICAVVDECWFTKAVN
jgi:hypothetical protein